MEILSSFIKNPKKTTYEGEDNDEKILILLRKSVVSNFTWLSFTFILLLVPFFFSPTISKLTYMEMRVINPGFLFTFNIFWYLFTIGYAFQNFLAWYFDVLMITNKKVIDIDQAGRDVSETTLSNIQDVTSKVKGNLGVVFDIGDIYIQTSAEQREFEFMSVRNPSKVRDEIADLVAKIKKENGS
ncbi:hypothetical protein ACFL15_01590 [Patescibacteria group bacterium]